MVQQTTTQPNFNNWSSHEQLLDMVEEYVEIAVDEYNMDVNTEWIIKYEVMTRAKKKAAQVRYHKKRRWSVGYPVSEDELRETIFNPESDFSCYKQSKMRISDKAFEEFDDAECKKTIRHELIHVVQQQKYGVSNHGRRFERKAEEYDTEKHCPKFTEYKYILNCSECGDMVAGRYKKSKTVKYPNRYASKCCNASLEVVNNEEDNKEEDNNEQELGRYEIVMKKVVNDYRFGEKIQLETRYEQKEDIKELDWEDTHRSWERWANGGNGAWLVDKESKQQVINTLEDIRYKVYDNLE